ncbi:MAG: Hsp20/alpha crystallin family protein [Deferrisomatales bacterium]
MKHDPFFPSPRSEVERLFDLWIRAAWGGQPAQPGWAPPVDIVESAQAYRLEMDLPGVRSEDLSITAEEGVLRVEGTRHRPPRPSGAHPLLVERATGHFVRTFRLPRDADPEAIRARLRDGVLTVEIPRTRTERR